VTQHTGSGFLYRLSEQSRFSGHETEQPVCSCGFVGSVGGTVGWMVGGLRRVARTAQIKHTRAHLWERRGAGRTTARWIRGVERRNSRGIESRQGKVVRCWYLTKTLF
jgi:hypothetical protein